MPFSFSLSQNKNTVGWRKNLSFTHVHKITNVPVLYIENTHNNFNVDHSFPCFYFTTKPLLPIQQNSVRMRGRDEREKLLLMSIKLPMYLFYTSNKISLIFLCRPIPYTFLLIIYVQSFFSFFSFVCCDVLCALSFAAAVYKRQPPPPLLLPHLPPPILYFFVSVVWVGK
jgi:hypothetical protein